MSSHPSPQPPSAEWQPTNPPAPAPPEERRSWFARHKVLTAVLALVALVLVAGALGGGDEATTDATSAAPTVEAPTAPQSDTPAEEPVEEPVEDSPGIGDQVRDGTFEFIVTGIEDGGTEVGDEVLSEQAQGRFYLVHVTVTNIGDEAQSMYDGNQRVRDEQGRTFEANSMAGLYVDGNDLWLEEINPGNSVSGTLVFDMPEGTSPAQIELHDSAFSGGVTVSLR
jgi:hypothetical protein